MEQTGGSSPGSSPCEGDAVKHLRRFWHRLSAGGRRGGHDSLTAEPRSTSSSPNRGLLGSDIGRGGGRRAAILKLGRAEAITERWHDERVLPLLDTVPRICACSPAPRREPGSAGGLRADARPRHWRQHGDLQRGECGRYSAAAVPRRESPGSSVETNPEAGTLGRLGVASRFRGSVRENRAFEGGWRSIATDDSDDPR